MFRNNVEFLCSIAAAVICAAACTASVAKDAGSTLHETTSEGGKYAFPAGYESSPKGASHPNPTTADVESTIPPSRAKDLVADFGLTPVKAWGTGDCQVTQGSTTVHCETTTISPSDVADLFVAVAANTGSTNLDTTITGYIDAHDFTIGAIPSFTTTKTKIVNELRVPNSTDYGSNYSFTGTQCLVGGTIQTQECGAFPKLMTVVNARVHQAGTGGSGTCSAVLLNPTLNSGHGLGALQGSQASLGASISGSRLSNVTVPSGTAGSYKSFDGYTYSNGWYTNVPVTGCGLSGATVDISFGIVEEGLSPHPNAYTSLPCNGGSATASTSSSDTGTGLKVLCKSHTPMVSFGVDNTSLLEAAWDDQTNAAVANAPECIHIPGIFMTKPIAVSAHAVHGFGCLFGDANVQRGFAIFPDSGNTYPTSLGAQVFACVDCNANNSQSPVQIQLHDPKTPNRAGLYLHDFSCFGMSTSSTLDDCITLYGETQWPDIAGISSWNLTGHVLGVGVSAESGDGEIAEVTRCIEGIRTQRTGSVNDPALALDAFGPGAGANNVCLVRYRAFNDPAIAFRMASCTTANGTHAITLYSAKVEQSTMEFQPYTGDAFQLGASQDDCRNYIVARSDGTTTTGFSESGISGITLYNPSVSNPAINTIAFHIKGTNQNDVGQIAIRDATITANTGNSGQGIEFDAAGTGGGNAVTMTGNGALDYQLTVSGAISKNPVEYDGQPGVVAYVDSGKNVHCGAGLGVLVQTLVQPPTYSCYIPAINLQASGITLNGTLASLGGTYTLQSREIMSATCSLLQAANTGVYYALSGVCQSASASAAQVSNTPENTTATYWNLSAQASKAPGSGQTYTYTLYVNSNPTALTCTITESSPNHRCSNTVDKVSVSVGQRAYMEIRLSASAAPSNVGNFATERDNPS